MDSETGTTYATRSDDFVGIRRMTRIGLPNERERSNTSIYSSAAARFKRKKTRRLQEAGGGALLGLFQKATRSHSPLHVLSVCRRDRSPMSSKRSPGTAYSAAVNIVRRSRSST